MKKRIFLLLESKLKNEKKVEQRVNFEFQDENQINNNNLLKTMYNTKSKTHIY